MRRAICALAMLTAAGCGDWRSEQRAQVATAGAALTVAQAKIVACQQPEIRFRTEMAITDAQIALPVAMRGDADAVAILNDRLAAINLGLANCGQIEQTVATHNQRCRGEVRLGMTKDEVRKTAWCAPDTVNKTETARGVAEEWVYKRSPLVGIDRPSGSLSFTGDTLTAIHRHE